MFVTHYNKVFWALFLAAVAVLLGGLFGNLPLFDVLLALILIVIALHKVEEDVLHSKIDYEKTYTDANIRRMNHLLGNHHIFTRNLKDVHEYRLHNLDTRRAELDFRLEQNYRELVRKIIEVENKLNDLSKKVRSSSPRRKKA